METKPPLPPFTLETAKIKVQAAEDANFPTIQGGIVEITADKAGRKPQPS